MTAALLRAAREEQFPLEDAVFLEPGKTESSGTDAGASSSGEESVRVKAQQYAETVRRNCRFIPGDSQEGLQFAAWKISEQMRSQGIVMVSVPLCVAMWNVMKNMHSQSFPCMTFRILWI